MFKKSFSFALIFTFLFFLFSLSIFFIYTTKSLTPNDISTKNIFVKTTQLPDLAIATETTYIRHRSLSDLFSIYRDDGTLREYFPSSYIYTHSNRFKKEKNIK